MLSWAAPVPDDAIKVMVEGGWVTLSGEVDWQNQKLAASDAVRILVGVKRLSDQIAIEPTVTMSAVKADIEAAQNRRAARDAKKISVEVNGGDVTLTGTVHSHAAVNVMSASTGFRPTAGSESRHRAPTGAGGCGRTRPRQSGPCPWPDRSH